MAFLVVAPVLTLGLWGEKVPVGGGLGWDGQVYGAMALDFRGTVLEAPITAYRVQRVLPSALVYAGLRGTGATRDVETVIRGFVVLNTVLLVGCVMLWTSIARALGIGPRGEWLGFVALFVNWAVLKQGTYYPVLTDISAFTLGLVGLHAYLVRGRATLFGAAAHRRLQSEFFRPES
jgi:hypothetical protein